MCALARVGSTEVAHVWSVYSAVAAADKRKKEKILKSYDTVRVSQNDRRIYSGTVLGGETV